MADTIKKLNNKGQVGIILLLVCAFALIFYAASMNIGRVSQTKAFTQVAAMSGASQLASQMSSYGQKLFQEQLGGKKRVCALTGIFMAILTIVIIIILIIITIMSGGGASPAWSILGAIGVGLKVALVLAIANLILQVAIIQPGITAMWNKIIQDTMGIQDQFMEQGIQIGLANVITDNKEVPDMQDFDNDFVWGYDSSTGKPKDFINRYAYYYSEKRLKDIYTPPLAKLAKFMNELRDFVYKTPKKPYNDPPVNRSPNWGLYDPPDCKNHPELECCYDATKDPDGDGIPGKPIPSYCNPCCIPEKAPNPLEDPNVVGDEFVPARPSCCDCIATGCPPEQQCGTAATCAALSPYGADYPYVYTRYYENAENNFPRKRVQVVPDEDPSIITIDGKTPMPTVANAFRNVFFENTFCPGAEPATGPIRTQYWGIAGPIYSFGKTSCPKDFVPVNQKVTPTPPDPFSELYPGYTNPCDALNPIKVSKVGYFNFEWGCDGIEPPPDTFISFRESIGTDDENTLYRKDPEFDPVRGANGKQVPDPDNKFRFEDTTGYYNASDYPGLTIADKKKGIFPFFYKMKDWGVDLGELADPSDLTKHPEHCYWYDKRTTPCVESGPIVDQQPGGLRPQLELPLDPANTPELHINTTDHVDFDNGSTGAVLRPDAVDVPSTTNSLHSSKGIIGLDNECAQHISPLDPGEPTTKGFWKPGGDRFCQPPENPPPNPDGQNWPYFGHCAKSGWPANCKLPSSFTDINGDGKIDNEDKEEDTFQECYCGHPDRPGNPGDFPDDVLDDLVYGISDFLDVSRMLFRKWESQKTRLAVNLKFWYPDIAEWIEPKKGNGACFICDPDVQGQLWDGRDAIKELITRLESWRDASYWDNSVWCVPLSDPKVMWDESSTFGAAKVQNVINCLTHNLSNDTRFQACYDACNSAEKWTTQPYDRGDPIAKPGPSAQGYQQVNSAQICQPLPRSLVPGFNPNDFVNPVPWRLQSLMDCEPKTCIERFRQCNANRCYKENACEQRFVNDMWTCQSKFIGCQYQCQSCQYWCKYNYVTPVPWYIDDDNSDNLSCTAPPIEEVNCAANPPEGSCYQASVCCTDKCANTQNICRNGALGPGNSSCTDRCASRTNPIQHTNCINNCVNGLLNCGEIFETCKDSDQKCNYWANPYLCYYFCIDPGTTENSSDQSECTTVCDVTRVAKISSCSVPPSQTGCVVQQIACNNTCDSDYMGSGPGSCLDKCGVQNPVCEAKATSDRVQCYVDAKTDPLYGWDTCISDTTKCSFDSTLGNPYDCAADVHVKISDDWTGNDLNGIACLWPIPPLGLPAGIHPNGWPPAPPPVNNPPDLDPLPPTQAFIDDLESQKGSCRNDPDPLIDDEMIDMVRKSIPEAKNQVAKFKTRRDFLAARLAEANEILAVLREAEKEITEFLEGPAREFIEYRKEFESLPSGLPYHAIYGWQGPPAESRQGANKGIGYWHVVKVEGRTPFKCDDRCGIDLQDPNKTVKDPAWPRVKTYTKNWGIERCYELVNTDGIVKFRVSRFDEDRDPNPNPTKFPGGQKLWDYRYFNPLRGRGNLGNLEDTCFEATLPDPPNLPSGVKDLYKGAFLMDKPENDPDCWTKANELLSKGASTELCAQYYYHGGTHKGMSHNFIKCRKDW